MHIPLLEDERNDFKRSEILNQGLEKLAEGIVAFANRYGGNIYIGINDDGTFEGKKDFDFDQVKGRIIDYSRSKISPIIDLDIEFLEHDEGDVVLIKIPKRKGIPHAVISKDQYNIKSRNYYIRTAHGKRPVTDQQLEWLFKSPNDPDFLYQGYLAITFTRSNLGIPANIEQPYGYRSYASFIDSLTEKNKELLIDNRCFMRFIMEITPYVFLDNLSEKFFASWLIEQTRYVGISFSQPKGEVTVNQLFINDIPKPPIDSLLNDIEFNLNIGNSIGLTGLCIPQNAIIEIAVSSPDKSSIIIKHEDFKFKFEFERPSWLAGIANGHPARLSRDQEKMYAKYQSISMFVNFEATFRFPDEDTSNFKEYYSYALTLKNILMDEWSFDSFLNKLPFKNKIYEIDNKLDKLLQIAICKN
ncbi:ATP-binding protein [Anaerospora hongkongensis]|uniref:AlbA family DNA-binding domain-containing protein n=1 Tax=Anaerospora hongkongensis TaxID=244830 RepID=UPI002FDA8C33